MTLKLELRALVVDDEAIVRKLLVRALTKQGFICDTAADGNEAEERVSCSHYHAVVTDLRMPNKHGHALAVHLLALEQKPVIVVHTGVIEPKLAKDLLARGVDDILFKPFDFGILAAKVQALVERKVPRSMANDKVDVKADQLQSHLRDGAPVRSAVTLSDLEGKLTSLSQLLPISKTAVDVYTMTSTGQTSAPQLAAAIQQDAALAAQTLRLANSAFYDTSAQAISQLDRAVVLIGQKRIGELALGMNALASLTSSMVPWMNIGLVWKQSMAAGLALEMLIEQGGHQKLQEGLLLSAIMHPLGRVVLATLYPFHYEAMVKHCLHSGHALLEEEHSVFPLNHSEVLAQLLATWNVPADVQRPLKLLQDDYAALAKAPEPIRTKAELIKLATFLGRVAVGRWEPWDLVEFPPNTTLAKLRMTSIREIITQTKEDVDRLATIHPSQPTEGNERLQPLRKLAYCDLSGMPFDPVQSILPSLGIAAVDCSLDELSFQETAILINSIGIAPDRLAERFGKTSHRRLLIVTDKKRETVYGEYGRTVSLPASYSRLRSACWEANHGARRELPCY